MTFDVLTLLLAAGGGFFAAAIGALHAFIFTGFMGVAGLGIAAAGAGTNFLTFVAFGPVFGPHIAFAGGVAAAGYAALRDKDVGGKDIALPLVSIERPDVLAVGAAFGMFGYVVQFGISKIPWFGTHTDSVALTVIISAFVVRLAFGRSSIFGHLPEGAGWGRFAPRDGAAWVRWHEKFVPNTVLGIFAGLLAAGVSLKLAEYFPEIASVANLLFFSLSAMSLLFLSLGLSFPVTHHITIIAGLGALTFLPIVGGNLIAATLIGAVFGMLSAWCGELFARLWHDHGNTHIDPPAAAIWPMTTVVLTLGALLGAGA
jgi:hypothetical protein